MKLFAFYSPIYRLKYTNVERFTGRIRSNRMRPLLSGLKVVRHSRLNAVWAFAMYRKDRSSDMDLRAVQKPLKDKYRADPTSSVITLRATGSQTDAPIACSVDLG